ncbi:recQ-mediated genome instability protein 1 [Anoplophora glabripennis]|uniref:recQ-mediated genome instability protein 1 n=1 Tax=Anoplophora glabripennis TaxID=217634 RepID=UPI000874F84C|nr:recQ-mediated genome instability protein 1 [Anoplophora glabripennis]
MMVIMDEISSIKTFFQSHSVHLSTAWLQGCVNWCKEEDLPANYTLKDLQHKVFEQWLLLDLRDVEVPCLPPDLSNKTKYILNGDYSLQMMKVVDISKPKYWQLQRIRNNTSANVESEIESSNRVLQLTLTDGVQEVEAMEYMPVPCLNLKLSPGIKIRLLGPITVRRGRLMLENKNVKVLGGEVEDLIVPNAAENVLASILKLPLNPKPNVIEESLLTANHDMFNKTGQNVTTAQIQNNVRNNVNPPNPANRPNSDHQARVTNAPTSVPNSSTRQSNNEMMDLDEEEELRIAAQIDMLMEVEEGFEKPPAKRKKSKTPDLFEDADIDDSVFESIDIPNIIEKTPKSTNTPQNNEKMRPTDSNIDKSLEFGDDLFEIFDLEAHLDQPTKESGWKPNTSQKPMIFTIEKLKNNMPNISNGKFKIKAKFNSVVEKLTVRDEEYHLIIKVEDDTGDLVVKVHTDLVSDMSGCCVTALMSLKTGILENDTETHGKVLEALRSLREKLVELNCTVEVQINSKEEFPVIVNILG